MNAIAARHGQIILNVIELVLHSLHINSYWVSNIDSAIAQRLAGLARWETAAMMDQLITSQFFISFVLRFDEQATALSRAS